MGRNYDDYKDDKVDYTIDQLTTLAKNKYQELEDMGMWRQKTPNEKKLIAMAANIAELEKQNKEFQHQAAALKAGKRGNHDTNNNNTLNSDSKKGRRYPEWKYVAPKPGEKQTKTVNQKTFHWCPHHKLWSEHTPEDCRIGKKKAQEQEGNPTPTPEPNPGLQLSSKLAAMAQGGEEESDW